MTKEKKTEGRGKTVAAKRKRVYEAPQLINYGDFRRLTLTKGVGGKDSPGAVIKTKAAAG